MGRREEVAVFSSSSLHRPPGMKSSSFLSTTVANADWCSCGGWEPGIRSGEGLWLLLLPVDLLAQQRRIRHGLDL